MITYRIDKTSKGWAMFRSRGVRLIIEADTKGKLVKRAAQMLAGSAVSVRINGSSGKFQVLRF
jgi:hypothetical protein